MKTNNYKYWIGNYTTGCKLFELDRNTWCRITKLFALQTVIWGYNCLLLLVPWNHIIKIKLATLVEGDPKAPFSIATIPRRRGSATLFPGSLHFTFDPHLIMLSIKQGGIKYHFLSLWYDSTWDWTPKTI